MRVDWWVDLLLAELRYGWGDAWSVDLWELL
jgi:hypothetical protein